MRVLLLKGASQYNVLRIFLDEAKVAFEAAGHEVVMLDVVLPEVQAEFVDLLARHGPFDLAFSCYVMSDYVSPSGQNIGEFINAPHVIQYVDHPLLTPTVLSRTPRNAALLVVDRSHVDVLKAVFGDDRFAYVGFNPHAAIGTAAPLPADAEAYGQSRPIRLFFSGTYRRPGEPMWRELPANMQKIFADAADLALAHDWLPAHLAVTQVLAARGIDQNHETAHFLMSNSYAVHEWVRLQRRYQFLKATAKLKLPLTVYGNGYEKDLYRFKNIDYRGPADVNEVLDLMRQSRIVMNVNANFGEGSHERPLSAMLAGAVCASERSTFYDQNFEVGTSTGDMTCFTWSTLEDDLQRIADLSEDPQALFDMARSGQAKVKAGHMWANRVPNVIEAATRAMVSKNWA